MYVNKEQYYHSFAFWQKSDAFKTVVLLSTEQRGIFRI